MKQTRYVTKDDWENFNKKRNLGLMWMYTKSHIKKRGWDNLEWYKVEMNITEKEMK